MLNAKVLTAALLVATVAVGGQVMANVQSAEEAVSAPVAATTPEQHPILEAAIVQAPVSDIVTGSVAPLDESFEVAAVEPADDPISEASDAVLIPDVVATVPTSRPRFVERRRTVRAPRRRGARVRVAQSVPASRRVNARSRDLRRTRKALVKRSKRIINRDKIWLIGVYR